MRATTWGVSPRVAIEQCCGVVIDVQDFFLQAVEARRRAELEKDLGDCAELLGKLNIPILYTIERPMDQKGSLAASLEKRIVKDAPVKILEKDFFDLSAEKEIAAHLAALKRKQMILTGCETDVCVLQSCLGLIEKGYEVFVVEDLLFSSTTPCDSALRRMESAGATLMTFKTLYHELLRAVDGSPHRKQLEAQCGHLLSFNF